MPRVKKLQPTIRDDMQATMQQHALVFRDEDILQEGLDKITKVYKSYSDIGITDRGMTWE